MAAQPGGRRTMIALGGVGAVATLLFWVIWFAVDRDLLATAHTEAYYVFENAFPLADAWLAATLTMAAWTLWRRRESGLLWLLLGGSSALYLGAMDLLFDLENDIYRTAEFSSAAVELVINAFCLVGGTAAIVWGWRHRRYFQTLDR